MPRLGRKNLGLGPRSSRLDVFRGGVIDLVLLEIGGVGRPEGRSVDGIVFFQRTGKDASRTGRFLVRRVHREPAFLGGIDRELDAGPGLDHSREGPVQIVQVGLVAGAASAVVSDRKSVV